MHLVFEKPIVECEEKIALLLSSLDNSCHHKEINHLKQKMKKLTASIYHTLSDWQIVQISRHVKRPKCSDYIQNIFRDVHFLHGDRMTGDDPVILGGLAKLDHEAVVFIGQEKGRDTTSNVKQNFGMAKPEGYRKAQRLMYLAERFHLPIITFIDTPGAYPGMQAEERNQSGAIANCLQTLSTVKIPIICTVIGEGGSGGALAIGVGDRLSMLKYSIYSVISPEGCASILWHDAKKSDVAAEVLHLTAEKLKSHHLIDTIIEEPQGGAHRYPQETMQSVKKSILNHLFTLKKYNQDELYQQRLNKLSLI